MTLVSEAVKKEKIFREKEKRKEEEGQSVTSTSSRGVSDSCFACIPSNTILSHNSSIFPQQQLQAPQQHSTTAPLSTSILTTVPSTPTKRKKRQRIELNGVSTELFRAAKEKLKPLIDKQDTWSYFCMARLYSAKGKGEGAFFAIAVFLCIYAVPVFISPLSVLIFYLSLRLLSLFPFFAINHLIEVLPI